MPGLKWKAAPLLLVSLFATPIFAAAAVILLIAGALRASVARLGRARIEPGGLFSSTPVR